LTKSTYRVVTHTPYAVGSVQFLC